MKENFDIFLIVMALLAAVVYAALHFFEAGYGYLFDRRYGPPVPNRVGWMVMESPVFILMCVLYVPGILMYIWGKRERGEKYFQSTLDKVVLVIIVAAACLSIFLLVTTPGLV